MLVADPSPVCASREASESWTFSTTVTIWAEAARISRDPIGLAGGLNLYAYVRNNPINFVDPFGLRDFTASETEAIIVAAAADAGAGPFEGLWNSVRNHSNILGMFGVEGSGKYDFKLKQGDDTFCVKNRRYRADEFGNFLAGVSGQTWGGWFGVLGVKAGGVLFDVPDDIINDRPLNFDADSRPDINAGAEYIRRQSLK